MIQEFYEDSKHRFKIYTDYENGRAYVRAYDGRILMDIDIHNKPHKYKTPNCDEWIEVPEHFDLLKQIENILHPEQFIGEFK